MTKSRFAYALVILGVLIWALLSFPSPPEAEIIHSPPALIRNKKATELDTVPSPTTTENESSASDFIDAIQPADIIPIKPAEKNKKIDAVPFTSQAPFGEWEDPRQQDGCEEASMIMAWHWLQNTTFSKMQALEEILTLSRFEEDAIGEWRSTSAEDTIKIFKSYYHYENITAQYNISVDDIIKELNEGNLVLVPTDGRKLGNPYYKQPGPPEHMLVIYDYDKKTDEFITNDPGTRRGESYRYASNILINSVVDYPTGHRELNPDPRTAMIVIAPES